MRNGTQLFFIVRHAAAGAAERERGADNDGIADPVRNFDALFNRICNIGRNNGLPDLLHRLFEQLSVLRPVDGVDLCTDQLDAPFIEEPLFCELAAHRQPRLPAERSEQAVRPLLDDDALERIDGERFEIDLVRQRLVRHDRRGVRVAKNNIDPCVLQHTACLRARIVEFGRLPDDDRPRTDDEYFFDIASLRHGARLPC